MRMFAYPAVTIVPGATVEVDKLLDETTLIAGLGVHHDWPEWEPPRSGRFRRAWQWFLRRAFRIRIYPKFHWRCPVVVTMIAGNGSSQLMMAPVDAVTNQTFFVPVIIRKGEPLMFRLKHEPCACRACVRQGLDQRPIQIGIGFYGRWPCDDLTAPLPDGYRDMMATLGVIQGFRRLKQDEKP